MKTKKFMSLVLALVMALSLAIPAFASSSALENTDLTDMSKIDTAVTQVNGIYQAPILALTVPKKINLLLNPYGVNVTINKGTAIEADVQGQIVSADNLIISRSNVPIEIKATATGTITAGGGETGAWTLSKTPISGTSVKKEALVYMVFGTVDTDGISSAEDVEKFMKTTPTENDTPYEGLTDRDTDITYATVASDLSNVTFADATTKKDGIIIQAGEGKETYLNQSLAECTVTGSGTTDDPYVYGTVSAVAFKLDGAMVANPKDSSWGKDDKLAISVAWKFVPGTQATSSGSGGVAGITATYDASDPAAITFTTTAPADADATAPTYTVTGVTGLTGVTAANCTWNGTTVTIPVSELSGATELGTDGTVNITVAVSYSDGTTTKTDSFAVAVTVSGN